MGRARIPISEFLANLPLFRALDHAAAERIAAGTCELDAPRGTIVFHRGDKCAGVHVVVFGQIKLSLQTDRGDEKVVELIDPGQILGEAATFLSKPYVASAEAIADSMLLHIAKEAICLEVNRNPAFAQSVIANLSQRLYAQLSDLELYAVTSGTQRVIRYLLNREPDGELNGTMCVTLPTKKWIIASRLNLTHEHFSRILHDLIAGNLIEVDGRRVRIPDTGRLRSLAFE
jgi:CRP/FNR family transcriptional regulator, dissimilatory nitrate respiration regulator